MAQSRANNSVIFVLDAEDEPLDSDGCAYINIVSLNGAVEIKDSGEHREQMLEENIVFTKVKDWTGETKNINSRNYMNFALSRDNVLFAATEKSIFAITLDNLELNGEKISLDDQENFEKESVSSLSPYANK